MWKIVINHQNSWSDQKIVINHQNIWSDQKHHKDLCLCFKFLVALHFLQSWKCDFKWPSIYRAACPTYNGTLTLLTLLYPSKLSSDKGWMRYTSLLLENWLFSIVTSIDKNSRFQVHRKCKKLKEFKPVFDCYSDIKD